VINFQKKICNICHRLLPIEQFAKNQRNKHGIVRRPSCNRCRTDIDKRAPKSSQAKQKEKERPKKGEPFQCPICQKRSIVGITAKIAAIPTKSKTPPVAYPGCLFSEVVS